MDSIETISKWNCKNYFILLFFFKIRISFDKKRIWFSQIFHSIDLWIAQLHMWWNLYNTLNEIICSHQCGTEKKQQISFAANFRCFEVNENEKRVSSNRSANSISSMYHSVLAKCVDVFFLSLLLLCQSELFQCACSLRRSKYDFVLIFIFLCTLRLLFADQFVLVCVCDWCEFPNWLRSKSFTGFFFLLTSLTIWMSNTIHTWKISLKNRLYKEKITHII